MSRRPSGLQRTISAALCIYFLCTVAACSRTTNTGADFDPAYTKAISEFVDYPSYDAKYESPEFLRLCVDSWSNTDDRSKNISHLREQGVFGSDRYIFIEGACSVGTCYGYSVVFQSQTRSRILSNMHPPAKSLGAGQSTDISLKAKEVDRLFEAIDASLKNEWKKNITYRMDHHSCSFITINNRTSIRQFAVITPFLAPGPNASPPAAVHYNVGEFIDGYTGGD